jgi:adenosylcobinamide-GDP ribazoletransferase
MFRRVPCASSSARILRCTAAAIVFGTRIPIPGIPLDASDFRGALACLPLVGFGIGSLVGAASAGLVGLSPLTRGFACVAASMLLTGALHEDGLADTADAFGGGQTRTDVLRILKDSRIGTFGAAALVVSIALRASLVADLGARAAVGLGLAHGLARCPPVALAWSLPYVTHDGVARSRDVARPALAHVGVATVTCALALAVAGRLGVPLPCLFALTVGLVAVVLACRAKFRASLGGVTGDLLGASEQVGEVLVLALLAMMWRP